MHIVCQLFLLALTASALITCPDFSVKADEVFPIPSHRALVAPLTKHPQTSLYTITLNSLQHSLIDLDAPFSWYYYVTRCYSVLCAIPPCQQARSYSFTKPSCPSVNSTTKFGCSNCAVTPINPVSKACAISTFIYDHVSIDWTDGSNPTSNMNILQVALSCAPQSLLKSFPPNVRGIVALSRSPLALNSQFSRSFLGLANKFAICLPSTSFPGVIFFGDGPYYLDRPPMNLNAMNELSYTPLLKNTKNSIGYYIEVKSIYVNGKATLLGNGSAQLSTTVPYTTLRSDVYKSFVKSFSNATKGIPRMKAVKPFSLCLKASLIGTTRIGFWAPPIDLEMRNGKKWTIYGTNSIKNMGNDVACLAFVDGGKFAKQATVIGSFQMENYLLLFDLDKSRLGFSSSLFFSRTSCANFNFTTNPQP